MFVPCRECVTRVAERQSHARLHVQLEHGDVSVYKVSLPVFVYSGLNHHRYCGRTIGVGEIPTVPGINTCCWCWSALGCIPRFSAVEHRRCELDHSDKKLQARIE